MLTLGIEYLTGYAVATSTGDRAVAEWPPHPGRVFMAMAAAYFESRPTPSETAAIQSWQHEEEALRWLEKLEAPLIFGSETIDRRDVVDVFVPPNDMGPTKRTIIPAYRTNRQPRTFPKVRPHQSMLYLHWPAAEPTDTQRDALERICAKVIRIGHSSSLVRMWLSENPPDEPSGWVPTQEESGTRSLERFRMPGPGCLDYLREQYNGEAVDRFYDFYTRIQSTKGKEQKTVKAEFEAEFGVPWKASLAAPGSRRPVLSMTQAYQRLSNNPDEALPVSTVFDDALLILDKREGPNLGLESTWQLLTALRGAIEKHTAPTPEWVNGHQSDGKPSEHPHRGAPRTKPGPDGYPLMPTRPGGPNRRQAHVWLRFDRPVLGPVLLGAGRYRGYGLCKPWRKGVPE